MNQENRDKLFRALGDIKDVVVNAAFDQSISLADRTSKNQNYNTEQRKQAREFGEEARARKSEYNSSDEIGWREDEEYIDMDFGKELAVKKYTQKPIANTDKAPITRGANKPKKPHFQWTYVTYLDHLKVTFKNGLATKNQINKFILSKGLGAYGITISDVQKDLQDNGIAKIITEKEKIVIEKEKEARLEQERKARIPKVELVERSGVESYVQVDSMCWLDDENADFFCT